MGLRLPYLLNTNSRGFYHALQAAYFCAWPTLGVATVLIMQPSAQSMQKVSKVEAIKLEHTDFVPADCVLTPCERGTDSV